MELFNKELTETDVTVKFSFPTHCLNYLPDFEGNDFVDLEVKDNCDELRVIRCRKRSQGYSKPVLSTGWLQFVEDYKLRVGDRIVLFYEVDHVIKSEYKIEAQRKFRLGGQELWGNVSRD